MTFWSTSRILHSSQVACCLRHGAVQPYAVIAPVNAAHAPSRNRVGKGPRSNVQRQSLILTVSFVPWLSGYPHTDAASFSASFRIIVLHFAKLQARPPVAGQFGLCLQYLAVI